MINRFFTKLLFQKLFEPLVLKSNFQKAYYVFEFAHLLKCLINKIGKKNFSSGPFWMDQSSDPIKENIKKYKKPEKNEKCIDSFSSNSDEIFKNIKVYMMIERFFTPGNENFFFKTYISTSVQVGINLKHFYTDEFQFKYDINKIEGELREINPGYLIIFDEWLYEDLEKKLSFLSKMKNELNFKLITFVADPHYYGVENKVRSFVDISDKLISMSSWSPLFSSVDCQKKLSYVEYFLDSKVFFPKPKELDLFFSGVIKYERTSIITYAAFVSNKLKLKTELHVRRSDEEVGAAINPRTFDNESYIDFVRRSRAVISICMKGAVENGKNIHIISGRVPEAMACGAALIQYKPKDDTTLILDNYYTPWKEYLPFSSRKELKDILLLLKYEPDIISEIAQNGRKRYLECYNAVNSWKNFLKIPVVE